MDEYKEESRGMMNLADQTADEFLKEIAKVFEQTPQGAESFVDLDFNDRFEHPRTVRIYLLKERGDGPTYH